MSTFYTEPTTGTRIATDVIGSDRYQIIKLDIGAPGSSVAATGTVLNGLLVDVSRIQGGVTVSQLPTASGLIDGAANPTTTLIGSLGHIWNGVSWDKWKDINAANNLAAFTGVPAVGLVVLDTVNGQMRRGLSAASAIAGGLDGTHALGVGSLVYAGGNQFFTAKGLSDGTTVVSGSMVAMGSNAGTLQPLQLDTNSNLKAAVQGDVGSAASDSGNPVKVGSKTIAMGVAPTQATSGQRANVVADFYGIPFVMPGNPNTLNVRATFTTAQNNAQLIAGVAGTRIVVTRLMLTASKANSVNVSGIIGFGGAQTPGTNNVIFAHSGVDPGGGAVEGNGGGIIGVGSNGDSLLLTSTVPTGGAIDVIIGYYTINA